ncbi:MAG: tRNA (guanosine(46)-N7)-methyltransferase TrmB [Rickettsiales bacterium]|jgi:tRNA (guanine-N7-)-methyltransferase|nr:tRNA (guanosine(46)-N7)-methyltransferase TrmB [Rickettsiales bacterium]
MQEARQKTFFGRRRGKGMSAAKDSLVASRMAEFEVALPASGPVDFSSLFDFRPEKISFEIGYGDGEHMAAMAKKNPGEAFIGAEAFENGNAAALKSIIEGGLENVRVFPNDANLLFPHMPEGALDRLYILYPDPWPKSRHEKRRMVNPANIAAFARMLKRGGEMLVATDHTVYAAWVVLAMRGQDMFEWTAEKSSDFTRPPPDWETTRYEQKALKEGRVPVYLSFRKK